MLEVLILFLINSALCFGFWNACSYEKKDDRILQEEVKGVLWFVEKWAKDKWFYKPLCGCLPCMASLHSIYPYWIYMYTSNNLYMKALLFYPIYILALSGLNYLIDRE